MKEQRGVGVFLPTRAGVEQAAAMVSARFPRITSQFYHGGEPIRVIRPFLEGGVEKPYLLAMTAAGQSALNVQGLDTVVIDDTRFANVVDHGRNVLTRVHLGANEILQMAGRVHGRVAGGRRVHSLRPRYPLRMRCVQRRPNFSSPEIPSASRSPAPISPCARTNSNCRCRSIARVISNAVAKLESRGIIENGRLTRYGKAVEAMPVDRPWAELLVHCDDALLPYVSVMSADGVAAPA